MTNGGYRGRGGRAENVRDISENQTAYIVEKFPDVGIFPVRFPGQTALPVEFLYRRRHLVTRERDVSRVEEVLGARELTVAEGAQRFEIAEVTHPVPGLALVELASAGDDDGDPEVQAADGRALFSALLSIRALLGPGVAAPNHLVHLTPSTECPATEPDTVPAGTAPRPGVSRSRCDGRGTLVVVVDTGLVPYAAASHHWMRGVIGDPDTEVQGQTIVDRYGGHGTFIASIVRAMAPRAEVRVPRFLKPGGAVYETELVAALLPVLDWAPDVISLSAGTHTWLDEGLLSFQFFVPGPLREASGTVLVAAAGNDGRDWRFAPAEMEGVIGVGALGAPGDALAWFSDFGDWVDVFAPGEDLVHAFPTGAYTYAETIRPNAHFTTGMARWSGTSFSTPLVSGLIAARMSGTGESSREAARSLLRLARAQALPGVGPVLHPGQACLCVPDRAAPGCAGTGCGGTGCVGMESCCGAPAAR